MVWWTTQYNGWTAPTYKYGQCRAFSVAPWKESQRNLISLVQGNPPHYCQSLEPITSLWLPLCSYWIWESKLTFPQWYWSWCRHIRQRPRRKVRHPTDYPPMPFPSPGSPSQNPNSVEPISHNQFLNSSNDPTKVTIVEVKDLHQTIKIEVGYGEKNAWLEWIKYSVWALNKSDWCACTAGRLEAQVVPFPLGWTSDTVGMGCMITLFQDSQAWGNESCRTLSMLFPTAKGPRQEPSKTVNPPALNINYTSCLS
ncbi:hypothetical protein QTO34_000691, partial [Cnephaeus nilssonii]